MGHLIERLAATALKHQVAPTHPQQNGPQHTTRGWRGLPACALQDASESLVCRARAPGAWVDASDSAVVMFTRLAPRRDARQAAHRGGSTGSSVVGVYAQRLGKPQDVRTLKAGEH